MAEVEALYEWILRNKEPHNIGGVGKNQLIVDVDIWYFWLLNIYLTYQNLKFYLKNSFCLTECKQAPGNWILTWIEEQKDSIETPIHLT